MPDPRDHAEHPDRSDPPRGSEHPSGSGPADAARPRPTSKQGRPRRDGKRADVTAWTISAVLHALLALLALVLVWSVVVERPDQREIIPIAFLSPDPGAPLTTPTQKPLERPRSMQRQLDPPQRQLEREVPRTPGQRKLLASRPTLSTLSMLSRSTSSSPLTATFYGTGGNARRIAYIVDASGSLIDTLDFVLQELRRSISQLSDQQEFTVLFFQNNQILEAPPAGWKRANAQHKRRVFDWISPEAGHIRAMGGTSPVPAIQQALRYRPELVFLLSDNITGRGRYEVNQQKLLDQVAQLNQGRTKFNTIQFVYPDPLAQRGMRGTLELIAEQTGGVYRFVTGRELDIE